MLLAMANMMSLRWLPNMEEKMLSISSAYNMLAFIFFSTTFIYTFIRLIGMRKKPDTAHSEMLDWIRKHIVLYGVWTVLCLLISIFLFVKLFLVQKIILLVSGLICVLYAIPFIPYKGKWIPLREVPYIKTVVVAIIWSILCVSCILVYTDMYPVLVRPQHILLFAMNLLFILALTIPFDIRDMRYDKETGTLNLAHLLGVEVVKKISILLLILYCILSFVFFVYMPCYIKYENFFRSFNLAVCTASIAGALAAIYLVRGVDISSKEQKFTFELDGIIIAQNLLILAIYSVYYVFD